MSNHVEHCICIIGARAGSQRIPGKNRQLVGGVPLYRNAVDAALESGVCSRVILSTDDPIILDDMANAAGVTLEHRPAELAGGAPSMWDVIENLMQEKPEFFPQGEPLMVLTPCHPFRTPDHVREAHELFLSSGARALVSVTQYPFPPTLQLAVDDGRVSRSWNGLVRAAEHPVAYYPNGAVTILTQETFLKERSPYTDNTVAYEIPWPRCLDIDEPEELKLARRLHGGDE